jgi:hypothetical protein
MRIKAVPYEVQHCGALGDVVIMHEIVWHWCACAPPQSSDAFAHSGQQQFQFQQRDGLEWLPYYTG